MTSPDYTGIYDPDRDFDSWYTRATGAAIAGRLRPGQRLLELGCATGLMTVSFVGAGVEVVGVDRSEAYLARARARELAGATFVQADVDTYDDGAPFDELTATNLIHELPDPHRFLRRCRDRLADGGHLHLSLQNPHSIHRLVALEMGLIDSLHEISARGREYSTLRLFGGDELAAMGEAAGFTVLEQEGVMLKPLPNDRMAALPDEILEGFVAVSRHFPRHCAMNYLVFER